MIIFTIFDVVRAAEGADRVAEDGDRVAKDAVRVAKDGDRVAEDGDRIAKNAVRVAKDWDVWEYLIITNVETTQIYPLAGISCL
ncbi:MAG: hypothetical protein CFE23_11895 [Flavobacterium sp. BFFFF1]|nr:MAG: hypothetical protein CFE23_11895 [Flavobacterium sp. BFFFF1]